MRFLSLTARRHCLLASLVLWAGLTTPDSPLDAQSRQVHLVAIPEDSEFPGAVQENALRLACAPDEVVLRSFILSQGLPYRPDLVRSDEEDTCHIFYQPSVPGFRARASDRSIRELFFSLETMRFLSGSQKRVGDVLDVAKQVLATLPDPLDVSLGVQFSHLQKWYQRALKIHFPDSIHHFHWREEPGERSFPWVQDYLKSGSVGDEEQVLVPWKLYEDSPLFGAEFSPLLETFSSPPFRRSKLSWEGGDVQFVLSPRDPDRLVMLLGTSARNYWGKELSDGEYAYVMQLEFGADEVVMLPRLTGHVDYATAFLPDGKTALVSEIMVGNQELARAAIRMLRDRFPRSQPAEALELARQLEIPADEFHRKRKSLRQLLLKTKASSVEWTAPLDSDLVERLDLFVDVNCRENLQECFTLKSQEGLLESDLPLLSDWISLVVEVSSDSVFPQAVLTVIESQLPGYQPRNGKRLNELARRLSRLGFQVIRVPKIAGEPELNPPWSGISYTNLLAVGDLLLVPRFGFGAVEDQILENLQTQLPPPFRVIPVEAQRVLLFNGGIHCVTGIIYSEGAASVDSR